MINLRAAVKKLEEEELFEQTAVKDAAVALDDPAPSSEDIDEIMRGLMQVSTASNHDPRTAPSSARFTSRSETVTPQWAAAQNMGVQSNRTPAMEWLPGE